MASDGQPLTDQPPRSSYHPIYGRTGTRSLSDIGLTRSLLPWAPGDICEVDSPSRERVAICRIAWFFVLLLCFFYVQTNMMVDQELTAGVRGGIVDEFFPDAGKASERLKAGEVTSGVKEIMHSDDVAQTLNWYSTFCRVKAATDNHIMDAWKCRLTQVSIGRPSKPAWDIFENRGLPSDKAEDPNNQDVKTEYRVKGVRLEPNQKTYIKDGLSAIDKICNERFLSWHLGRGDDPLGKLGRIATPFGNATAFSQQVLKPIGITSKLHDDYDEYTVLDHNSMWKDLSERLNGELGLTEKLDDIDSKLDEHIRSLADKASASRAANSSLLQLTPTKGRAAAVGQPFHAAVLVRSAKQTSQRSSHEGRPGTRKRRAASAESFMQLAAESDSSHTEQAISDTSATSSVKQTAFRRTVHKPHARDSRSAATLLPGGFLQRSVNHDHANTSDLLTGGAPEPTGKANSSGNEDNEHDYNEAVRERDEDQIKRNAAMGLEDYGTGCFETTDIVGMLLDEFIDIDRDGSGTLDKKETLMLLANIYDLKLSDKEDKAKLAKIYPEIDPNGDASVDVNEYLNFIQTHANELKTRERGFLSEACRNHHWGLIGLCKPQEISAEFRVQNIHRLANGYVEPGAYLDVKLQFKEVGKSGHGTGWYKASVDIDAEEPPGGRPFTCLVAAALTTILLLVLLAGDALYTLVLLPFNFFALRRFGDPRLNPDLLDDIQDEEKRLERWQELITLIKSLFDGRQVRLHFLSLEYLALENFTSLVLAVVVIISAFDAFTPQIVPMGVTRASDKEKCANAFLNADIRWSEQLLKGSLTSKRGMSPVSYMRKCMEWHNGAEFFLEVIIEIVYAHQLHAYVAALLCLRVLQLFEYWERMKWLPLTIKLAYGKLINFMIMYLFAVASYACLFYMTFGRLYPQFDTFSSSCWALMLYSFGFTFRAEDGIHPFVETSGTLMVFFLFFFMITVVTIGLNFFTTIILDAYARVGDPEFDEQELLVDAVSSISWISSFVNVPEELFKRPDLQRMSNASLKDVIRRRPSREDGQPASLSKRASLESIQEEEEPQEKASSPPAMDAEEQMKKKMESGQDKVETVS